MPAALIFCFARRRRCAIVASETRNARAISSVRTPPSAPENEIVTFSVRAGDALCLVETTGRWQAVVYLP